MGYEQFTLSEVASQILEESSVTRGNEVPEISLSGPLVCRGVGSQRCSASNLQEIGDRASVEKSLECCLMVSSQERCLCWASSQVDEEIDYVCALGPTIDVIAHKHEYLRSVHSSADDSIKSFEVSMDVANDRDFRAHRSTFGSSE